MITMLDRALFARMGFRDGVRTARFPLGAGVHPTRLLVERIGPLDDGRLAYEARSGDDVLQLQADSFRQTGVDFAREALSHIRREMLTSRGADALFLRLAESMMEAMLRQVSEMGPVRAGHPR